MAAGLQPPVLQVGALDPWRDFLDVRDVCAAYVACLRAARRAGAGGDPQHRLRHAAADRRRAGRPAAPGRRAGAAGDRGGAAAPRRHPDRLRRRGAGAPAAGLGAARSPGRTRCATCWRTGARGCGPAEALIRPVSRPLCTKSAARTCAISGRFRLRRADGCRGTGPPWPTPPPPAVRAASPPGGRRRGGPAGPPRQRRARRRPTPRRRCAAPSATRDMPISAAVASAPLAASRCMRQPRGASRASSPPHATAAAAVWPLGLRRLIIGSGSQACRTSLPSSAASSVAAMANSQAAAPRRQPPRASARPTASVRGRTTASSPKSVRKCMAPDTPWHSGPLRQNRGHDETATQASSMRPDVWLKKQAENGDRIRHDRPRPHPHPPPGDRRRRGRRPGQRRRSGFRRDGCDRDRAGQRVRRRRWHRPARPGQPAASRG